MLRSSLAWKRGLENKNSVKCISPTHSLWLCLCLSGESGLGKSTLINSLFLTDLYAPEYPGPSHRIKKTVQVIFFFSWIVHTFCSLHSVTLTVSTLSSFCALTNSYCSLWINLFSGMTTNLIFFLIKGQKVGLSLETLQVTVTLTLAS